MLNIRPHPLPLAAGVTLILATAVASGPTAADTMTFVSFGGAYTESQKQAYIEPFKAETGITVNIDDYNGGLAQVASQARVNNIDWDVIDVEMQDAVKGCDEGLFMRLDDLELPPAPDGTAARDDFLPGTLMRCGVGSIIWSNIIAYNNEVFEDEAPQSIVDFFDLETFPGRRGMMRNAHPNLEWALIADGVPSSEVYDVLATEEGVDRAFRKLDAIKPEVVWWETHAQAPQLLADKEVVMTTGANGRFYDAIESEGQPFTILWDHQVWNLDLWAIPEGAPNAEVAKAFVQFASRPERMADQTNYISYGPVRKSAAAMIDPDIQSKMPTAAANFETALRNDFEFWADYGDELSTRFNNWLLIE